MKTPSATTKTLNQLFRLLLILSFILACRPTATPTVTPPPPTVIPEPPNHAPTAGNSELFVQQGSSGTLDLKSLASDREENSLTFLIKDAPKHGTANINASTLSFTPATDYLGIDQLTYKVNDGKGGTAQATIDITISIAPALDANEVTNFADATDFLYTGDNPIQTGVTAGTIVEKRVAVLRGIAADRDNKPLVGVTITVLNHPEYGETLTRDGGIFDIAVNGGSLLTLDYEKNGFLSSQRQIDVPWQDYVQLPDVVMITEDSQSTLIDLTTNTLQVAQGKRVTDSDGTRQQTLFFPEGTKAEMTFPDGTRQDITSMHVRSTEYTIGENGLEAMPAELPANSAYTYATAFRAVEAVAAGANNVRYTPPIISYVENFLNFDIGAPMPMGYYDDGKGVWIPSETGKVIKILSITDGKANLDIDGSGNAAIPEKLAELGVTDAEREELAKLYSKNQSLWRIPVPHFSDWDANLSTSCKNPCPPPETPEPEKENTEKSDCDAGSIIDCQNQTLGETVGIVGTPYNLAYQSNRTAGHQAQNSIRIPISSSSISSTLQRIELSISVAGQQQVIIFNPESFPANEPQYYDFVWNGTDAYGRKVSGQAKIQVELAYIYPLVYQYTNRFGYSGNGMYNIGSSTQRTEFRIGKGWQGLIGAWQPPTYDLGGWDLNIHHSYNPQTKVLYLGSGGQRSVKSLNMEIIETVAGGGGCIGYIRSCGDGGSATAAGLWNPTGLAIGQDGSVYIVGGGNTGNYSDARLRKIDPDGIITTIAGGDVFCNGWADPCGDGGPAIDAKIRIGDRISVGPDGSLYLSEYKRVRKIDPNGIIDTIAGTGGWCTNGVDPTCGDGGLATKATFDEISYVTVAPDGSLYIADSFHHRIRRVDTNGIINTVAGGGDWSTCSDTNPGDDRLATQACLWQPMWVAFDRDGSYFIADLGDGRAGRIRRVRVDGIISTVAGGQEMWPFDEAEGDLATKAYMPFPTAVVVGPDGSLYIAVNSHNSTTVKVRRISPDGIISTVAGTGETGFAGDGGPARQALFNGLHALAFGADGNLYIADRVNDRIRRIRSVFPGSTGNSEISVPSEDGSEIYIFTFTGRHLRTLNALTGTTLYKFDYNNQGQLISVTDGDNNKTTITRDTYGNPTGIVAPFGQITTFARDPNGYLATIANPAGEAVQFTYTADGLMTNYRDARNNEHIFEYDAEGRLEKDTDPAFGFKQLTRVEDAKSFTVTVSNALSDATQYRVETLPTGTERHVNTYSDGTQSILEIRPDATRFSQSPDGSTVTETLGADPRWGLLAPIAQKTIITMPSGLTAQVTRTATLTNPDNPFSLETLTETTVLNGRAYTSTYTTATRTWVEKSPEGREVTTRIDAQGRIVFEQVTGLAPVNYVYDIKGRLEKATLGAGITARTATFTYNSSGYLESITDPLQRIVKFEYDLAGRITKQTLPDQRVITYTYDPSGNLKTLTPPGKPAHTFNYTPIDLQSQYIPPDLNSGEVMTQYDYNADHQLKTLTRPDGQTIAVGYDSAGRLDTLTIARGILDYNYNATTGNVESIAAPGNIKLAYGYDGALLTSQTWGGLFTGTTTFTYDENFRWKTTNVNIIGANGNSSSPIDLKYDDDGLLTQAGDLTLTRNPQTGMLEGSALGKYTDAWVYNDFGEPLSYTVNYNVSSGYIPPVFEVKYNERDTLGRIKKKTESISGTTTIYEYDYDAAGRLWHVTINNALKSTYTYNANGNRLSVSVTNPNSITNGTYDKQDILRTYGSTTYTYTANGELKSKSKQNGTNTEETTYQYDELGNLISVKTLHSGQITYLVDGQGRRVGKQGISPERRFLYESQLRPIAELDSAGNIVSRFIYATRANVPDYMVKGGEIYRFILDHLGSPRLIVDVSTGDVMQRMDYDEFGRVLVDTNPGFQPFGFAGGLYDPDTGLVRFGARDYDAETGRWITKDPIGFDGNGTNVYVYSDNDPLNFTDYIGLDPVKNSYCKNVPDKEGVRAQANRSITDQDLLACVKRQIDDSKLMCNAEAKKECSRGGPQVLGACEIGSIEKPKKEVFWCDRNNLPDYCQEQGLVHELAHSCGWNHGQGGGVPGDSGELVCKLKK